jgi:hypothetical protein
VLTLDGMRPLWFEVRSIHRGSCVALNVGFCQRKSYSFAFGVCIIMSYISLFVFTVSLLRVRSLLAGPFLFACPTSCKHEWCK